MANYLELATLWWKECPACEYAVPWKGCDDCGGTNKVWPMRRPCKGGHAIIQTNHKDSAGVKGARCEEVGCPGWLPIEDMATLCRELGEAKVCWSVEGPDLTFSQSHAIISNAIVAKWAWADDPEESLVNASIEWMKKKL